MAVIKQYGEVGYVNKCSLLSDTPSSVLSVLWHLERVSTFSNLKIQQGR